jgi:ketosteroid isomerase-like protein
MTLRPLCLSLALLLATPAVSAHGNEKHDTAAFTPGRDTANAMLHVSPEANDAIASVERFSAALSAGDVARAGAELDPNVLVLESGGVERSREEYLGGHAKSDAAFIKSAHVTLKHRTAQAAGDLAWVASESDIHATREGKPLMISSTETMVVKRTAQGWKIVHIHWSSRRADAAH